MLVCRYLPESLTVSVIRFRTNKMTSPCAILQGRTPHSARSAAQRSDAPGYNLTASPAGYASGGRRGVRVGKGAGEQARTYS